MLGTLKLIDVVANLASYDEDLTIYVTKPWTCQSEAVMALEPDQGGLPHEAASRSAEYFIEVFIANELLEGWIASEARPTSAQEQCE